MQKRFTKQELLALLEETIGVSTEEYIEDISSKIGTIDKNKNYFIELIHYISVNLDEELN